MKKIILAFLMPALVSLACSITPAAHSANPFPTAPYSPTLHHTGTPAYTATAPPETCTVTADVLNLRDAPDLPGFESHVLAWLSAGDVVIILPDPPLEAWITVQAESLTGWINSKFCERNTP